MVLALAWAVLATAEPTFIGWTQSDRYVEWSDGTRAYALEAKTGELFSSRGDSKTEPRASRTGPGGAAASVGARSGSLRWDGETARCDGPGVFDLELKNGKRSGRVTVRANPGGAVLTPYFDSTGRRVAFFGTVDGEVHTFVVALSPTVELLDGTTGLISEVTDALDKHQLVLVAQGTPRHYREDTVIYASGDFAKDAALIAKDFPGGARVEKLTWKARGDLVVTVGERALGADLDDFPSNRAGDVLGWTTDGRYAVWTTVEWGSVDSQKLPRAQIPGWGALIHAEKATLAVAEEARSGQRTTWLLEYRALSDESKGQLKKKLEGLPDAAAFEKWKAAHPLAPLAAQDDARVTVTNGEWRFRSDSAEDHPIVFGFGSKHLGFTARAEMKMPFYDSTAWVDPTGRRALIRVLRAGMHGNVDFLEDARAEHFILTGGPSVEVLAPGDATAGAAVADAAEKAGWAVAAMGVAKQARPKTVVFAAAGKETDAAKLAAALPGGASVEKLTWPSKAELVIAVGGR